MTLAAYIPFLHPIGALHDAWYLLLLPLAFGISVIYRAIRLQTLDHFWRRTWVMTAQIVLAMIALAIALTFVVQIVIPALPAE
ncbi:MAG: hypothetical protein ACYTG1_02710 [Planctomycetota bacterium]